MSASSRIGFMQGRLSPQIDGKIQAFPAAHWREEFALGEHLGFASLEWTLDQSGLDANPLMTADGRQEIARLEQRHGLKVGSITGDCFMQAPFWKLAGPERMERLADLQAVIAAAGAVGADRVVVPLVDNGSVDTPDEIANFLEGVLACAALLRDQGVRIAIESDLPPTELAALIAQLPRDLAGVNLDIGNSASLGWSPEIEIPTLGDRIINVHVKDRVLGGSTVPLGEGDADFPSVFRHLAQIGYGGALILQTARAADGDHAGVLANYRRMVLDWLDAA
jgi:hexulose-6-phosphate isomerase